MKYRDEIEALTALSKTETVTHGMHKQAQD